MGMKSERLYVKCPWTGLAESLEHCAGIRKLLILNPAYKVLFFIFILFFLRIVVLFLIQRILFSF